MKEALELARQINRICEESKTQIEAAEKIKAMTRYTNIMETVEKFGSFKSLQKE
jgi:hypothetical protein